MTTPGYIAVRVTEEDIENGIKCSPANCPISLAVRRVTGLKTLVGTGRAIIRDSHDAGRDDYTHRLSDETKKFILDFDRNLPVQPFVAQLTPIVREESDT